MSPARNHTARTTRSGTDSDRNQYPQKADWWRVLIRPPVHAVLEAFSRAKAHIGQPQQLQLEIGSGPTRREGWITADRVLGPDYFLDLRRKLPFRDGLFEKIYCSHVLEHFSYRQLQSLLLEVYRVLKPGGIFLIAVPNAALYVEAYLGKRDAEELLKYQPAVISKRPMDVLNYMFYMGGHHRFMFDNDNLGFHCAEVGFIDCASRLFDPTLDNPDRDYESLYFSCRKPS